MLGLKQKARTLRLLWHVTSHKDKKISGHSVAKSAKDGVLQWAEKLSTGRHRTQVQRLLCPGAKHIKLKAEMVEKFFRVSILTSRTWKFHEKSALFLSPRFFLRILLGTIKSAIEPGCQLPQTSFQLRQLATNSPLLTSTIDSGHP